MTEEHQQLIQQQEKLQQDIQSTDDPPLSGSSSAYSSPSQHSNHSPVQFGPSHAQSPTSYSPTQSPFNPGSPILYRKSGFTSSQQIPSHMINHPTPRLPQHVPSCHPQMHVPYNNPAQPPARFTSPKFARKSQAPGSGSPRLVRKSQQPPSQIPSLVKTPYNQPKYYHNPGQQLHSNPGQPLHNIPPHLPSQLSNLMVNTSAHTDHDPKRLAQDLYNLGFRQVSCHFRLSCLIACNYYMCTILCTVCSVYDVHTDERAYSFFEYLY